MARYIDADHLKCVIGKLYRSRDFTEPLLGDKWFTPSIEWSMETLLYLVDAECKRDVADIVRCKDCKYRYGTPGQPNIICLNMKDDDFCSYGEKKAGE